MRSFHHRIPTNGWQSLLLLIASAVVGVPILGASVWWIVVYGMNIVAILTALFAAGWTGIVALIIVHGWRYPDARECIVADGCVYWHTPWPGRRSVKVSLDKVTRVIVDGEEGGEGTLVSLEFQNGEQLEVPDIGVHRRIREFVAAVRSQCPTVRVTQYGTPRAPL